MALAVGRLPREATAGLVAYPTPLHHSPSPAIAHLLEPAVGRGHESFKTVDGIVERGTWCARCPGRTCLCQATRLPTGPGHAEAALQTVLNDDHGARPLRTTGTCGRGTNVEPPSPKYRASSQRPFMGKAATAAPAGESSLIGAPLGRQRGEGGGV